MWRPEMVFEETLEGKTIRTGDIVGTVDGGASLYGFLFKIIGDTIPGRPDHVAVYLGPDGICVEAGPRGVNLFRFFDARWDTERMLGQRGIVDSLYGLGDLVEGRVPDTVSEKIIRSKIRHYVLEHIGKPYNLMFRDPDGEKSFYCSQLVYSVYRKVGIVIPFGSLHPTFHDPIITPEDVWNASNPLS
jgi:hypothetical protein